MAVIDIYLARHGQTAANAAAILQGSGTNPPLNDCGKRQSADLAEAMKDEKLDWIITSALERAIETANAVAKYHKDTPFLSDARLNEISWGKLDGARFADIKPTVDSVVEKWQSGDFDAKIEGGESANEGKARILAAFADLLAVARERKYRKLIVCIHGRIMRVIMASLVDRDLSKMQRFPHTNCSYHQIRVDLGDDPEAKIDPEKLTFEPIRIDVRDHLANLAKVEPSICCNL
ncbi:hypothetical protein IWW55_005168 [Coemansia sp. RSA 2706]|nr:hypothetical protein LPJ63_002181 [Coemansia sp. RSA 2711]KAJ1844051.1 hypothetical protein LPJ70_003126 [Coemansia sp. RSA 2708]KAJ2296251.1 hypothetical protein IWW55_005168 [Coemansia sp. RSA 2706]KAJ2307797.1 hypothetical protein IWW54_004275 [Coemansia sp. RSA 2705]KAJ2316533.1 hypothetical protein IWW52_003599 [Coemansia sp. RSA 2704]KAJ2317853.1 hypothetical protein IWW51_005261 [Coemansia sp. RSA 2702]KAJ2366959.1 hypothetical protein H4S01_002420 [Coemansia sp. RSA 2610]KAJ238989